MEDGGLGRADNEPAFFSGLSVPPLVTGRLVKTIRSCHPQAVYAMLYFALSPSLRPIRTDRAGKRRAAEGTYSGMATTYEVCHPHADLSRLSPIVLSRDKASSRYFLRLPS